MASENGWEPLHPTVDQLEWVTVPGTTVRLQFLKGQPLAILRAFAADFNAYVEPLRDADSAGYTATNSVATSNHLNGTAMDLNWNSHRFRISYDGFDATKIATMRELLAWYEKTVWWGQDWQSPIDCMHLNMGYDTYGSQNVDRVQDFINRKIRADGFSTFRRGVAPVPPPPPLANSGAADVLARATGLSLAKATQILPTMAAGLLQAQCTSRNRIAMFIAQTGEESAGFSTTTEFASGAEYEGRCSDLGNCTPGDGVKYKGRTWIQITGKFHYGEFSRWARDKGLVPTSTYFVDNPAELSDVKWAGVGAAWYWTVSRPQINALCDAGDILGVTRAINGGTHGLQDRTDRYHRALAVGDALLTLLTSGDEDDMAGWDQAKVDRAMVLLENMAGVRRPSRSGFRWPGEGDVDTCAGFAWGVDGNEHMDLVIKLAEYGDVQSLALLMVVAHCATKFPERKSDAALAQRVLDKLNPSTDAKAEATAFVQSWIDAEKAA